MTFDVKLFAYLRQEHGESVAVDCDPTAGALLDSLFDMGIDTKTSRLAVNQEFVKREHKLRDGDEIAVIPPVSGG